MSSSQRMDETEGAVPLGPLLARADRFKSLFTEGMRLVEEAAAYLDGPGRDDAATLTPALSAAYSAESMRLTTRLMQIASWLLIRRAVANGEMRPADAPESSVRIKVSAQNRVSTQAVFLQLPPQLQRLTERSLRLQRRVLHLDRMVNEGDRDSPVPAAPAALADQHARLLAAFGPRP